MWNVVGIKILENALKWKQLMASKTSGGTEGNCEGDDSRKRSADEMSTEQATTDSQEIDLDDD